MFTPNYPEKWSPSYYNRNIVKWGRNKLSKAWSSFRYRKPAYNSRLNNLERMVKGHKPEVKYFDINYAATAQPNTWTTIEAGEIIQGSDYSERTGNEIKLVHFQMRYVVTNDVDLTVPVLFRIIVVRMDDYTTDVPAAIMQTDDKITSQYKINGNYRYKILYDQVHHIFKETESCQQYGSCAFSLHNAPGKFTSVDGSTWRRGKIFVIAMSTAAVDSPILEFKSRVKYTDV